MGSGFDYAATASRLANYFARHEAEEGKRWASGRLAAESWASALQSSELPVEVLIDLDLLMLEGEGDPSSAWEELLLAYRAWREHR
jgi:hypothetical protein